MFRNNKYTIGLNRSNTLKSAFVMVRTCISFLIFTASPVLSDVDSIATTALRYRSDAEIARLPAPAFSLLPFLTPSEQRTPFECASVGSFEEWVRNRKPWKTILNFHYYDKAKRFVSISDYPSDPHPEEFELNSTDVEFLRTLVMDQFGNRAATMAETVPPDLQRMASLLGIELTAKLLPKFAGSDGSLAVTVKKAFWQERSMILVGMKLVRSITPLETTDGRRIVRVLSVLQIQDTLLPLGACYYATALTDPSVKYSDGLLVPSGGLEFAPAFVGAPLYVFILDGGPPIADVTKNVDAAVAIWKKAGIILSPTIKSLSKNETITLLGKDEEIKMFLSCDEGDFYPKDLEVRKRLSEIKPNQRGLAVFFGKAQRTQSDPDLLQVYINYDPNKGTPGLTVAHEIGHLFFGAGHVGGDARVSCSDPSTQFNRPPVMITSPLMRSPQSSSNINYQDATIARKKALSLPEARWW
jgi:hypothetical protein